MSRAARVDSIDALSAFKVALWKFAELSNSAIGDAEGEIRFVLRWLETEQVTYWQGQLRKRQEAVVKAREAVNMKKLFKGPDGSRQSAAEEEKALSIAQRQLAEAEQKLIAVKRSIPRLQKEMQNFHGAIQNLATAVQSDVPVAVAKLEKLTVALQTYAAAGPPAAALESIFGADDQPSVARAEPAEPEEDKAEPPPPTPS